MTRARSGPGLRRPPATTRALLFLVATFAALVALPWRVHAQDGVGSAAATAQPAGEGAAPTLSGQAPPPPPPPPAPAPAPGTAGAGDDAAGPAPAGTGPDRLTVYVITFSPGDHPFYKFGHNAIWIHDERKTGAARDKVYNYGTFSFGDPALLPKFFLGRFMYWLSAQTISTTLRVYKAENRSIEAQELALSPAQELELQRLLEENLKPENKHYKYDYYRDNCATRVRDMIDRVTGGRVREVTQAPARMTYREHTLRLTADLPSEYVILHLVMGDLIDKPMTEWDEGFLPMEVQAALRKTTVFGPDGTERPLVKEEKLLQPADRPPPLASPPVTWPYSLLTGLVLGGLLALLGRVGARAKAARVGFGALLSFFGLVWGFFGWFFLAAWALTDHEVGYRNENVMLCVPWAIVLVGTGINVARARARSVLRAEKLLSWALGASVLATLLKALPWFDQSNGFFLVFFVPFWAGAYAGARFLAVGARAAVEAVQGTKGDAKAEVAAG